MFLTTVIYEKTTTIVYINIILTDIFFNIHRFMISYQNIKIKKDNSKRKLYGVIICVEMTL
jgi:fumarate reductase subunit D